MGKILILGDIHGKWKRANSIVDHELGPDDFSLCTGDLVTYDYQSRLGLPLHFIFGNHDSLDVVDELSQENGLLRPIQAGQLVSINGVNIVGLPGIYSAKFIDNANARKKDIYFTRSDIESVKNIEGRIDILLTHEAPLGCGFVKYGKDVGHSLINDIISRTRPKMVFVGHHHMFVRGDLSGVDVIGLDYPHRSYLMLNTENYTLRKEEARVASQNEGYKYEWER